MRLALATLLFASTLAAQTAVEIPSPAAAGSMAPFLSSSHGVPLLSWLEPVPDSDRTALRVATFVKGAWTQPRTVVEGKDLHKSWADFPAVIADDHGVWYAQWLRQNGQHAYDLVAAASRDGGATWSTPVLVNRDGKKNEHGFASLAPLPKGGAAIAWLDGRNMVEGKEEGEMSLRYATIDAHGAISGDTALDTRACECCNTGMAMTAGGPVVVYRDRSADEIRDISVLRRTEKGWASPKLVHADGWKIAGCPVNGPQADAVGKSVAVAWFTGASDQQRAFVAFSDDGGATFAAPIRVDDGKPAGRVDVVMLDSNTAYVTWLEQTPAGGEIRARRITRGGDRGFPIKVTETTTARSGGFARMAAAGRDVFVAWNANKAVHIAMIRSLP